MENCSYQTVKDPSTGLFKDKGSKFFACLFPVTSEKQIKDLLLSIRREKYDARHHCYAWRLGPDKNSFRANDDGEPSGTAGKPILGQIMKFDLTDILIIVVRYFGGTLLGTGGLINAYRTASADAIGNSTIITKTVDQVFDIIFPAAKTKLIIKVLGEEKATQLERFFDSTCRIRVSVPAGNYPNISGRLAAIEDVKVIRIKGSY